MLIQTGKVLTSLSSSSRPGPLGGAARVDPGTPARDRHDLADRRGASYLTDDPEEAVSIVVRCYEERCAEAAAEPCKADAQ